MSSSKTVAIQFALVLFLILFFVGNTLVVQGQIIAPQPRIFAPIGIVDYGVGPNGYYQYLTRSFVGSITLNSLATVNNNSTTIQQNVFLSIIAKGGNHTYWIQNIAGVSPSSRRVSFGSYIFNFSGGPIASQGLTGNGQVLSEYGCYWCYISSRPGQNAILNYPSTIILNLTCGLTPSNQPYVDFSYEDGYGLITYDHLIFKIDNATSCDFIVKGISSFNSRDAELVFCGAGSKQPTINFTQADIKLRLEYWNGHNYEMIPNAYNYGISTAEGATNVWSQLSYDQNDGAIYAKITEGNGSLGILYNETMTAKVNITSLSSGKVYVVNPINGNHYDEIPFSGDQVHFNIFPGYYEFIIYQNGLYFDQGNFTLHSNQTLSFQAQTISSISLPPIPETPNIQIVLAAMLLILSIPLLILTGKLKKTKN